MDALKALGVSLSADNAGLAVGPEPAPRTPAKRAPISVKDIVDG
jgi:hypothetical protein